MCIKVALYTYMHTQKIEYADDDTEPVSYLARIRIPSLAAGLLLGIVLTFMTSRFEQVLEHNIKIAFFIPFVVYMAAAVGMQTQEIYIRDLRSGRASFKKYLIKETLLGFILGFVASLGSALISYIWFRSAEITLAVSLAMFCAVLVAPLVALLVTQLIKLEHLDPAVGSGPIATIIQDTFSILIYGLIASAIIL
ncbi:MAG: magnesium transporter [Parcubacteria group bacterium Gr01-1014_48]|nr:MAG: magnesium transporter [Parcubacteria group bacterium Greene0416_14]TSC73747.1 MAG: magnesium transporter [Parcubacteria group bacterium Gr01-1014_48]TSD01364.1 MAG: magnesium transporter [Parcubacteria group bacterium Greene1014_15]TSD06795.1 MAG: magnesium transporter [Parcubacteria group bacterium Greene0714_4]